MKKALFISALACTAGFYACKKDGTTTTVTNTVHDTTTIDNYATGMVNADTLTAGLKVGYGTSVTGEFPASSTDENAPLLDSFYTKTYKVVKGRYLTINPQVVSGSVAGYYVEISGASSYFKVDYTQAYNLRKARRNQAAAVGKTADRGYVDSSIVFKLPAAISGDTFFVKYAAYDNQGLVSNVITGRVLVLPGGSEAFTDSITGTWKYYGSNYYYQGEWSYADYPLDTISSEMAYFNCADNALVSSSDGTGTAIAAYYTTLNQTYVLSQNSFAYSSIRTGHQLDYTNSTCSNYVYSSTINDEDAYSGGFSFDATTRRVTVIAEYEGASNIELYYETYYLAALTDTYMVLSTRYNEDSDNNGEIAYFKYIKQ